ncbi:MAG: Gfo/Idh/MocA family oxidoreductase [Tepidisphaeraceae bacterium]
MNRRQFLTSTTATAAAMALSACQSGGRASRATATSTSASATTRPLGANGDIRVAVVGFNSHGKSHINAYKRMPGVRLVALCDVDEKVLQTQADLLAKENVNVTTYRDIRKLLDSKEVDAISCAMTNRWHSLAAVWACQAGKDACVEKPVSHCIWEGRQAVLASRKYGRMVQADLDYRSQPTVAQAYAFVQSGQIGRIVYARAWDYKRRDTMGKVAGPQRIPDNIDYDLWVGPGPMLPVMRKRFHYDWHWQWATGNGEIANNGSHQLDQVRWALGKSALPTTVMSFGGRFGYADDGQTPNTQVAVYDYDGIPVIYESRGLPEKTGAKNMSNLEAEAADGRPVVIPHDGGNQGVAIFCEGGYCYDGVIYDNDGKEMKRFDTTPAERARPQENFIKGVRSRRNDDLRTDIEQGHRSATFCHMGNVSFACGEAMSFEKAQATVGENVHAAKALERMKAHLTANGVDLATTQLSVGPTLTMDSAAERFTGAASARANLFLRDSYRAPFVVPEKV